jgi:L-malate glycosyltransferase
VVVPSAFLYRVFEKRNVVTLIIPNVIDLARFSPKPTWVAVSAAGPHLIVTRNLDPIYDIGTALRAFQLVRQQFPAARLTITGTGSARQDLEVLAEALGVAQAVVFTGRLDNEVMTELYRCADVMINPSLVDNMPISILEAWASGVPVVSTNVGGVPFMVEDGESGLLVPPQDAQAMASAVLAVLGDARLENALRETGLARARQYAWPSVRDKLLCVYRRVMAEV